MVDVRRGLGRVAEGLGRGLGAGVDGLERERLAGFDGGEMLWSFWLGLVVECWCYRSD